MHCFDHFDQDDKSSYFTVNLFGINKGFYYLNLQKHLIIVKIICLLIVIISKVTKVVK